MLRSFTSILMSALLATSLVVVTPHVMPSATYSTIRASLVEVTSAGGSCSGVVVDVNTILTAAHCDGKDIKVDGVPAAVIKKNEKADLMLLITKTSKKALPVASERPKVDERVVMAGYPLGAAEVITEGRLQDKSSKEMPHHMVVTSLGIFGNSGGPILVRNGLSYEIVGIASMLPGVQIGFGGQVITHLVFVVNTETINEFLR